MSNREKDLRNAKTAADPDLTFTYNDLLEELTNEYKIDDRFPGGVTADELAAKTNLKSKRCQDILNEKQRLGELKRHKIIGRLGKPVFEYYK